MSSQITLSERTAKAGGFFVAANLLAKVADLFSLIILARILMPADFGLVAMAMTFVVVVETVSQVPIGSGIVRASVVSKALCDTAFTLALMRGGVVALVLALLSYPVSQFYNDDRLVLLLWVLSLSPIARGLTNPRVQLLHRKLDFRLTSIALLTGKVFAFFAGTTVALLTRSYWSVAIITISAPLLTMLISYVFVSYRPKLSLQRYGDFADILSWSTLNQVISAVSWQSDRLILGGVIPRDLFGKYAMAANLAGMPLHVLLLPLNSTMGASFAQLKNSDRLRSAYLKSVQTGVFLLCPILLSGFFFGEAIIILLFGKEWAAAVMIFRILCLVSLIEVPVSLFPYLALILKQTKLTAAAGAAQLLLRVALLIFAAQAFGVLGAVSANAVAAVFRLVLLTYLTKQMLDITVRQQILYQKRNVLYLVVFAVVASVAQGVIEFDSMMTLVITTGMAVSLSFFAYATVGYFVWRFAGKPAGPEYSVYHMVTKLLYVKKSSHS